MSSLRTLFSELVEKRLWPVALLLVVALVAVPFVLAKSPAPQPEAGTPPTADAAAAMTRSEPAVRIVAQPSRHDPLKGKAKNPFRQQHVPRKAATADGGGTPPVDTAPADGTGTSSPGGGSNPSGGAPTTPAPQTYAVAAIDVRFGKASGPQHTHESIQRLRALPRASHPIVIFMGMRKGLDTAVFLLSSDVHAQGDGTCTPSRADCTAIEVREGDVVLLDVTGADGRVTQYELDLLKITISHTTSKSDAERAYARVSRAGARLLARRVRVSARNTAAGGRRRARIPYHYAVARGVLHIAPFMSRRLAR